MDYMDSLDGLYGLHKKSRKILGGLDFSKCRNWVIPGARERNFIWGGKILINALSGMYAKNFPTPRVRLKPPYRLQVGTPGSWFSYILYSELKVSLNGYTCKNFVNQLFAAMLTIH